MDAATNPAGLWLYWLAEDPALAVMRNDTYTSLYAIAVSLAVHADDDCITAPSWAVIQEETGLSRRSVARHTTWLRQRGWLVALPHSRHQPGRYRLRRPSEE